MSYSNKRIALFYIFYVSFIPNTNLTNPLKGLGTFFTTIVKNIPPLYLANKILIPPIINPIPIVQSHTFKGRNNTKIIPNPQTY